MLGLGIGLVVYRLKRHFLHTYLNSSKFIIGKVLTVGKNFAMGLKMNWVKPGSPASNF